MKLPRRPFDEKFLDLMRPDARWDGVRQGISPRQALGWGIEQGVELALTDGANVRAFELRELVEKLGQWEAGETYAWSAWDERWDVGSLLPTTNEFHKKISAAKAMDGISRIVQSYGHILNGGRPDDTVTPESANAEILERATAILSITSPIQRIFFSLGAKFGVGVVNGEGVHIMTEDMSAREQLRISPDGRFDAAALFEEAQLNGAPAPTLEDAAHYFKGVEHILHFESAVAMLEQLAALSVIDPELQAFCLRFYKQHKSMIFSGSLARYDKAAEKLVDLIDAHIPTLDQPQLSIALSAGADIVSGYREFTRSMIAAEAGIVEGILAGEYGNTTPNGE